MAFYFAKYDNFTKMCAGKQKLDGFTAIVRE